MKTSVTRWLTFCVALVFATNACAQSVERQAPRTWRSGLGVGLVGLGVAGIMLGTVFQVTAAQSSPLLTAYRAPTRDEAAAARLLSDRDQALRISGFVLLGVGATTLLAGALAIIFDRVPVAVSWAPLSGGSLVLVQLRSF